MEVLIDRLDHQGRGIGKINNKTIFVYNALPSELVDVEIVFENKKYMEGKVIKYITISNKRVSALCPYYDVCGGCDLRHVSYEDELSYKEDKVKQIISKFSSIDIGCISKIKGNNVTNYRNKATFHVKEKIGYYGKKSNDIIAIDSCLIVDDKINVILSYLKNLNLTNVYEIVVRTSRYLDDSMVVFKVNSSVDSDYYINCLNKIASNIIIYQDKKYNTIYGKGYILDMIGDYKFKISPDSFFQVNTVQANVLYNKVLEYLEPSESDSILDLYCGTGTIGIFVSKYVKKVFGVEINEFAIKDALFNKEINSINNIDFKCLDASDISGKFDKIIVDPPRSGLSKKTIDYLINGDSNRIVYVSCDTVTLARDLELLKDSYCIKEITPVDMFSNTYHVECVCVLTRKTL